MTSESESISLVRISVIYPLGLRSVLRVIRPRVLPARTSLPAYDRESLPITATAIALRTVDLPTPLSPSNTFHLSFEKSNSSLSKAPISSRITFRIPGSIAVSGWAHELVVLPESTVLYQGTQQILNS